MAVALTLASAQTTAQIVKSVTVRGNQNVSTAAIESAMRTKAGATFVPADVESDENALFNLGLFQDVKILTRNSSETEVEVFVEVVENPVIMEFRIIGNTVVSEEKIAEIAANQQELGLVYNNRNARPIREGIEQAYEEAGYFVQLNRLEPDPDSPGSLLIDLLEPRVGSITLTGLDRTKPRTVENLIQTEPGEVFSTSKWRRDLEELLVTGWFDRIDPAPPAPTSEPGVFDLNVDFTEAKTSEITGGVVLDPQSRLAGTLGYTDRNFRGTGQSTGIQLSQGTAGGGPSAELAYTNPFYDARQTSLTAKIFSTVVYNFTGSGFGPLGGGSNQVDSSSERRTGFSVDVSRRIQQDYRAGFGISAQTINTIDSSTGGNPNDFVQQDGDLAMIRFTAEKNTKRPSVEPYTGQQLRVTLEPGYADIRSIGGGVSNNPEVLGQHGFLRSSLEWRQYWSKELPEDTPFDQPRDVVAARVKYGRVDGTVPFFEQLFVGGTSSLRGYENQRYWGSESLLASLEYRKPIQKSFTVIGFVDYGGAWGGYGNLRDFQQTNGFDMHLGYGIGLAFRTPIAPIRIDFAFNEDGGSKTHFSFGTSF